MPLPTRSLGRNGAQVSAIGWGLMGLSSFCGPVATNEERFKAPDHSLSVGETSWGSSDIYADSEDLLGKWFVRTGKREEISPATNFGFIWGEVPTSNRSRGYVKKACAKSLGRLGVEHIDLYYIHRLDPNTPIEETMEGLKELVQEGKIRHIGISECSADTLLKRRTRFARRVKLRRSLMQKSLFADSAPKV